MATYWTLTFEGEPTEADFERVSEMTAQGFTSGQLINEPERDVCGNGACGLDIERHPDGIWAISGMGRGAEYCNWSKDRQHTPTARRCEMCGGPLRAGEGDGTVCGPCTSEVEGEWWTTDERIAHESHPGFGDLATHPDCRLCAAEARTQRERQQP
jgi:hypothetical protein